MSPAAPAQSARRGLQASGLPSQGVRAGARARGDTAVPRPPLRRRPRPPGRRRVAAVRRHRRGAAPPAARPQPLQRRAPDPAGARRGARGRRHARGLAPRAGRPARAAAVHVLARAARARARRRAPPPRRPDRRAAARAVRAGRVRRHERTMEGPKAGRLAVLRAVRANLSPIFMAYGDPSRRISETLRAARRRPRPAARDDRRGGHVAPALARLRGRAAAACAIEVIGSRPLTIIDGHHRYETALAYRDERRAADGDPDELRAYDFAPVYLANRHDPGLHAVPHAPRRQRPEPRAVGAPARAAGRALGARGGRRRRRARAPRRRAAAAACARSASCAATARRRCTRACAARRRSPLDVVAVETLVLRRPARTRRGCRSRPPIASPTAAAPTTPPRSSTRPAAHRRRAARAGAHRRGRRGRRRGRPDDAAEVDVLLPEDPRRHGLQPARSVRPVTAERWLEVCRAMRDAVVAAVADVPRARRADELGRGAGGDLTVAVDQAAEDAALGVLAAVAGEGEGFTVVSEEVGERSFGGGGPLAGRDRPDRRQPQRQARPAALRALGRRRRRPGDGRRRARLRLRPRQRRGVDRPARRRGDRQRRRPRRVAAARAPAARRPRGDAARASRAGRRRAARRGRARARAGLARARALPSGRRPPRRRGEPAPNGARSIDIAAAQLVAARGRRRRRAARRAGAVRRRAARPRRALARRRRARRALRGARRRAARHRLRGGRTVDPG